MAFKLPAWPQSLDLKTGAGQRWMYEVWEFIHQMSVGSVGDATLVALAAFNSNGLVTQTAADTFTARTIIASTGITVANGSGVSGNPTISITATGVTAASYGTATQVPTLAINAEGQITSASNTSIQIAESQVTNLTTDLGNKQPLDATLTSLAAFNTNGLLAQTAADTFTGRTITGTSGKITVTNGDGVAGNPTLTIDAAYVGQNTITTLGTITTGVWHGTQVGEIYGGTNQTTYALGDTLYSSAANTLSKLSGNTTTTKKFLVQTGDGVNSAAPAWTTIAAGDLTGLVVSSLTGTTDQVNVSASTGAVTLSTPQNIATTSTPQFKRIGVGIAPQATQIFRAFAASGDLTGTTQYGLSFSVTTGSDCTASGIGIDLAVATGAAAYTMTNAVGIRVNDVTQGAGSTITQQFGISIADQTKGSTLTAGIRSLVSSGTGKWNIYASGTAINYLAGELLLGTTTSGSAALTFGDAKNIAIGTTTGTKIGTATTQKLAFYNSTPIVQPSGTGETVGFTAGAGTTVTDQSTFTGNVGSTTYRISDIVKALKNLGLMAA